MLKIIAILVFLFGAALLANGVFKSQYNTRAVVSEPTSFVVHYIASRAEDDAPIAPYQYRVRAVSPTGEWKETRYSFDGNVKSLGGSSDGLYVVDENSRQYYGLHDPEFTKSGMRSLENLRNHPLLARTEEIAGITTYVLKHDAGGMETETSYAPETGVTPLRTSARAKPGTGKKLLHIVEAVKVEFRDVSDEEIKLPSLPISYTVAEEKAQMLRKAGQHEQADAIERAIASIKLKSDQ